MANRDRIRHIVSIIPVILGFALTGCTSLSNVPKQVPGPSSTAQSDDPVQQSSQRFDWWPTDAKPAPYEDPERGGYWWWPEVPGEARPWGNRGFVYVHKIIFDDQGRPQYLLKKIVRNVKIYFDYDKADLRKDALPVLADALEILRKDEKLTLLLTGNTDVRGDEQYNYELAQNRALSVRDYLVHEGLDEERVKILSRGKLDAVAKVPDIVGLQKDRNVHFVLAEAEEIKLPKSKPVGPPSKTSVEEVHHIETPIQVEVKKHVVQEGDSLWKIAEREYGDGGQWQRIYDFNRDRIKNPKYLMPGEELSIPIE